MWTALCGLVAYGPGNAPSSCRTFKQPTASQNCFCASKGTSPPGAGMHGGQPSYESAASNACGGIGLQSFSIYPYVSDSHGPDATQLPSRATANQGTVHAEAENESDRRCCDLRLFQSVSSRDRFQEAVWVHAQPARPIVSLSCKAATPLQARLPPYFHTESVANELDRSLTQISPGEQSFGTKCK